MNRGCRRDLGAAAVIWAAADGAQGCCNTYCIKVDISVEVFGVFIVNRMLTPKRWYKFLGLGENGSFYLRFHGFG